MPIPFRLGGRCRALAACAPPEAIASASGTQAMHFQILTKTFIAAPAPPFLRSPSGGCLPRVVTAPGSAAASGAEFRGRPKYRWRARLGSQRFPFSCPASSNDSAPRYRARAAPVNPCAALAAILVRAAEFLAHGKAAEADCSGPVH